jgi:hypothetical protein
MRRCLNPKLSRSGMHRCLKRHGLSARLTQTAPAVTFQTDAPAGFIHVDVKYLPPLGHLEITARSPALGPIFGIRFSSPSRQRPVCYLPGCLEEVATKPL